MWFQRGILLARLLVPAMAGFPTWNQDVPNKEAMPLTELPVEIKVANASTVVTLQDDLLLISYERVAGNETVEEDASVASNNALLPIDSDTLCALVTQQGNGTTGATFLIQNGNRVMLIRTASCNTTSKARKLGATLALTIQSSVSSASDTSSSSSSSQKTLSCTVDLSRVELTTIEEWTELAASLWQGFYKDIRFKGPDTPQSCRHSLRVLVPNNAMQAAAKGIQQGRILAEAVALARDVVNAPHNVLNSLSLAQTAQALARKYRKTLSCRVLSVEECQALGMGAFLGVARGSETTARFIHLTYRPRSSKARKSSKVLGIVGKGLLFDTGGYNIKTGMSMTNMKFDCGGAAAVLGAARAIAELEPHHVECHILIAACENMINERAMVPGDILVAGNKKTIEVGNTDAEGRLTMADALVFADRKLKCEKILELSTLTGACMMALGTAMAGLFTKDDDMAEDLLSIGEGCGDRVWRMPMEESYADDIKSKIADLKNIGGRFGGAITAALFLQNFVDNAKYAHVDMAGPVWSYKENQASGWGARLVTAWVLHQSTASSP